MDIKRQLRNIALLKLSSIQCYRILCLLSTEEYTQAQICSILDIPDRSNLNKYVKELDRLNLLRVTRIEGKNKYLKAVDLDKIKELIPGQIKINLGK